MARWRQCVSAVLQRRGVAPLRCGRDADPKESWFKIEWQAFAFFFCRGKAHWSSHSQHSMARGPFCFATWPCGGLRCIHGKGLWPYLHQPKPDLTICRRYLVLVARCATTAQTLSLAAQIRNLKTMQRFLRQMGISPSICVTAQSNLTSNAIEMVLDHRITFVNNVQDK